MNQPQSDAGRPYSSAIEADAGRSTLSRSLGRSLWVLGGAWTGVNSLLGLLWGSVARSCGGGWRIVDGVLEIHGPGVVWLMDRFPGRGSVVALTLGQVVLARTDEDLFRTRRHERVHVIQYLKWGPFFLPAYFAASAWFWIRGLDPYRDNPFEVAAYAIDDCRGHEPLRRPSGDS